MKYNFKIPEMVERKWKAEKEKDLNEKDPTNTYEITHVEFDKETKRMNADVKIRPRIEGREVNNEIECDGLTLSVKNYVMHILYDEYAEDGTCEEIEDGGE